MTKMTMKELDNLFSQFNREHNNGRDSEHLIAYIVFKQSNWDKVYTEEQRTYEVWSNCKRWMDGMISNSYTGDCIDGSDKGVRLDWYNWKVDYCYIK